MPSGKRSYDCLNIEEISNRTLDTLAFSFSLTYTSLLPQEDFDDTLSTPFMAASIPSTGEVRFCSITFAEVLGQLYFTVIVLP